MVVTRRQALEGNGLVPLPEPVLAGFGPPVVAGAGAIVRHLADAGKINNCTAVGGHNLMLGAGTAGTLTCGSQGIAFWVEDGRRLMCDYDHLLNVEVGGPGVTQRGGRIMGGGFGLTGVLEGTLVATVLNKLATRTSVNTLVGVVMQDSSMTLHTSAVTPAQAMIDFAPALGRLAVRRHTRNATPASAQSSVDPLA